MSHEIRFSVLSSGSSGNAYYVETAGCRMLIDAGLSCQELVRRIGAIGRRAEDLDALLITHEHTDHIKGAGPLARRFRVPVYLNAKTWRKGQKALGNLPSPVIFQTGQTLTINGMQVETFTKCHDAVDPIGLVLCSDGARLGLVTDLGRATALVRDRIGRCDGLILEFNYEPEMLSNGPYPLELKRRIKGPEGHLSNHQGGELLEEVAHKGLKTVVLAHLSEVNNLPEMAYRAAEKVLNRQTECRAEILLGTRAGPGPVIEI